MHDFGYDVSDYTNVDPVFGDLDDFDELTREAGERGLAVLLDVVPCHTSIEHPWFREHPDWYIWAEAPNNWSSAFGGSAWEPMTAATTSTPSTASSRISIGTTPTSWPPCRTCCASGFAGAPPAIASTPSTAS